MLGLKDSNMIDVRLATLDDAEVIGRQTSSVQQLHDEALPFIFKPPSADLFPLPKLAALIHNPNCIVAVAEIGGRVVGHIYGAVVNRADSYLYIYQIGVDDDARRQGAGAALITLVRDRGGHWALPPCKSITGHSMRAQETSSRRAVSRP